ncbi:MAG TPA: nucleoside kinase, partial [Anaerolineales bacterium]|nr:nucleoside kinase [Anaerolineales bacterium]
MTTPPSSPITFVSLPANVHIQLPDERVLSGPRGTCVGDFLQLIKDEYTDTPIVGAIVNNELRELTYPILIESLVQPLTMADEDGMRMYRRTLTLILEAAFEDLFPTARLTIDHSVAAGGYFCQVSDHAPLTADELDALKTAIWDIIRQDLPLIREKIPLQDAIHHFETKGHTDKVRLLAHRKKDYLILYRLGKHCDYHHGYMLPSSGYVQWFDMDLVEGGFTLRFPRRSTPKAVAPPSEFPKMLASFRRYGELLASLGIESVGNLNDAILANRIQEIVLVAEARHEQRLAEIASLIAERRDQIHVILIAGPSSSGKTTSSKRLSVQLLANGISPYPLEMDNYFVEREKTPRDENGNFDFECINALDRERLADDLKRLVAGERVQLPRFNFRAGRPEPGDTIQLQPGQIIIMEGIHGLHPDLLPSLPAENAFRIYISALTQLNLDRYNRVSTTDTRLLRRIVRDARERGYTAFDTIQRWDSVTRGEKRNIFPYQENADIIFNSALVYELSILRPFAEPLLRQ